MTRKASLIIAFYNNTQALGLIFKALSAQSSMDFEVVIADDGSKKMQSLGLRNRRAKSRLP